MIENSLVFVSASTLSLLSYQQNNYGYFVYTLRRSIFLFFFFFFLKKNDKKDSSSSFELSPFRIVVSTCIIS